VGKMFFFRRIELLSVLFLGAAMQMGSYAQNESRPVSQMEKMTAKYKEGISLQLPVDGWKIKEGDNLKYAKNDYDDSKWKPVKINSSIFTQGFKSGFCWYRNHFVLPENFASKGLIINLGYISNFDEVYVNGVLLGSYGTCPPAQPIPGSSWVARKYYVPSDKSPFKAGKENLIAVRIHTGYAGGMYSGIPKIYIVENKVISGFQLKIKGGNSLASLITNNTHLNRYQPGQYIAVAPEFAYMPSDKNNIPASLEVKMFSADGKILQSQKLSCQLQSLRWTEFKPVELKAEKEGKYFCDLILKTADSILSEQKIPFTIAAADKYTVPTDEKLTLPAKNIQEIKDSVGTFGPRVTKDDVLKNSMSVPDARGSLTFSVFCADIEPSPLVFINNVRPSPKVLHKPDYYLAAKGREYDGFNDAWMLGHISIGKSKKVSAEVTRSSWSGRTWTYSFEDGKKLEFRISSLSPAWNLRTDANSINIFQNISQWKIGLPSHIAYMDKKNNLKVIKKGDAIDGSDMSSNWILTWFNGSENWSEFDMPWLFALEKKTQSISINDNALTFTFNKEAGNLSGMPLFGVKLLPPSETESWSKKIPEAITERCSFWSKVLMSSPVEVKRSFSIDYPNDRVILKDQFEYQTINNEWNTVPLKIAPLPPALPLASSSGNIPITVNDKITDLEMATLHGPYTAILNKESALISIEKMLHFSNEARSIIHGTQPETLPLRKELKEIYSKNLKKLSVHPWEWMIYHEKYVPGNAEPEISNIILGMQYLTPELKEKVFKMLKDEMEKYLFLEGKPEPSFQSKLLPIVQKNGLTFTLTSPMSGKKLSSYTPNQNEHAIDSVCWESLRLYTAWHYAYAFKQDDFIKNNWEKINMFFNLIPNSHDWAVCISWDTFSGIRVGNGLQESGIIHAGASAMARMAQIMGDRVLRDKAAYFSVMQLVGMQAALNANKYLRQNRPWPASHTESNEMEFVERSRNIHYVEFNEFAGFSQNIIKGYADLNAYGSFVMTPLPEIMRPYKDIWSNATDDFFDPKYFEIPYNSSVAEPISIDMFLYMTNKYPKTFQEIQSARWKFPLEWTKKLSDIRAALDWHGKINYEKLWSE